MRETLTKNYVSDAAFRKWVTKMNDQFNLNKDSGVCVRDEYTYVYLRSRVGVSKRNSTMDEWDSSIGIAYAWARCTGQSEYYVKNYVPKPGEYVTIRKKKGGLSSVLRFVAEGTDEYCFRMGDGSLTLIDKSEVLEFIKER